METIENIQQQTINLHELPTGKQSFIATIGAVRIEKEHDYWYNVIDVPYIYLKNIRIFLNNSWFNVEQSGNFVRSKVGKRLQKLELEENDIIAFNAIVKSEEIRFWDMEGQETHEDENTDYYKLPKSYKGNITLTIYHTEFSKNWGREWKNEYVETWDRKYFNKHFDKIYVHKPATSSYNGYHREISNMSYTGRVLKNFSNIEKY